MPKRKSFNTNKLLKWLIITPLVLGIGWMVNLRWYKPFSIDMFFERVIWIYGVNHPELLSRLNFYDPFNIRIHKSQLDDISDESSNEEIDRVIKQFEMLRGYKSSSLSPEQRFSAKVLDFYLEDYVWNLQFPYHDYSVDQLNGPQIGLPLFMNNTSQINSILDADSYLNRLTLIPDRIEQSIQNTRVRQEFDAVLPKPIIRKCIAQINELVKDPIYQNVLYLDFKTKILALKNVSDVVLDDYHYEVKTEIEDRVIPEYKKFVEELEVILENAPDDAGVWRFPDGDSYYEYLLQKHLAVDVLTISTQLSPDSLLRLAQEERDIAKNAMQELFESMDGVYTTNLLSNMSKIKKDRTLFYNDNKYGRKDYLLDFSIQVEKFHQSIETHCVSIEGEIDILPMFSFQEGFIPNFYYYLGSLDNSASAKLYIDLSNMTQMPKYTIPVMAARKGFPGAHYQRRRLNEQNQLPTFRRFFTFSYFIDGWELYALDLARQWNYFPDELSLMESYQEQIVSAEKMIADIRINHHGWKRAEAIKHMAKTAGITIEKAEIEVDACIADPGRACAAITGYKIFKLQEQKCKEVLGDSFNQYEFIDEVLSHGALPLEQFKVIVGDFIEKKLRARH